MYQYKLYNNQEIEKLHNELEVYKKVVESRDADQSILYWQTKHELEELKQKIQKNKGEMKVMEESYHNQLRDYADKEKKISSQIHAIHHSIQQLKKDVQTIRGEVKELRINELLEKINQVIGETNIDLDEVKEQVREQNHEFQQLSKQLHSNSRSQPQTGNRQSEYRQLQRMLKSAKPKGHRAPPPSQQMMTNPKQDIRDSTRQMITIQNGRKTFHNTQYELNKNIIVNKTTAKTKKAKIEQEDKHELLAEEKNNIEKTEISSSAEIEPVDVEEKPTSFKEETRPKEENMSVRQENGNSSNGLKKTWLLAKSLWKK
ncbi:hypothetical protein [Gracilibacillus kekensis]|uniref:Uncharacterized protein n=1 Tax=Gracilibacillus kekensis TaxID=1027249 RepID=A0A1M7NU53_9BACI|nr:hypothetical protein [Gracilibacillus kekensis]SHN07093.1 hypothetical protein SAMN05216179_1742 [Gracilibacillus kekensis]